MLPTPVFLPGKPHGQRSLAGYSPWGCRESDTAEHLRHTCAHTHADTHTVSHKDNSEEMKRRCFNFTFPAIHNGLSQFYYVFVAGSNKKEHSLELDVSILGMFPQRRAKLPS